VSILLRALESAGKDVDYYALDLSLKELKRTLEQVPLFKHVKCHGLHGTYDDGLDWLKMPEQRSRPKCVMTLGSSIGEFIPAVLLSRVNSSTFVGNFHRPDAAAFLRGFSNVLQPSDSMLVGLDATHDPEKV
jgi:uncharacterized SAM-dependent methyltransferase